MRGLYLVNAFLWFVQAVAWAAHRNAAGYFMALACFIVGVSTAVFSEKIDTWSW